MLIIALPLHAEGPATEYVHLRAGTDGASGPAQVANAARLPRDAGTVVAVVPAQALAWHTLTPPPVGANRLAAALEGLLEERLLEDPAHTHVVYSPEGAAAAAQGQTLTVLVCQKAWLRQALAPLQAQGLVVSRIVPEWSPQAPNTPVLWVGGRPHQVQAVASDAQGAVVLPPPPWPNTILATFSHPEAQCRVSRPWPIGCNSSSVARRACSAPPSVCGKRNKRFGIWPRANGPKGGVSGGRVGSKSWHTACGNPQGGDRAAGACWPWWC